MKQTNENEKKRNQQANQLEILNFLLTLRWYPTECGIFCLS